MRLKEYLKRNRLVADGAMGTYFEMKYPEEKEMAEACNLSSPEKIRAIHLEYMKSGAKLIRTNTFAANLMFFDTADQVKQVIQAGWQIAEEAVKEMGEEVFIAADIGPVYDPQFLGKEQVLSEYYAICDTFLECGADVFVLETQAEFTYVREVAAYLKKRGDVCVMVQFSVDQNGYTRSGLGMARIIEQAAAAEDIDVYGFNCGVGAAHLKRLLEQAVFPNEKPLAALPNAGYPVELRGKTIYQDNRAYFVEMMEQIAGLGADLLGGCCGTTPEYIKGLSEMLKDAPVCLKKRTAQSVFTETARLSVEENSFAPWKTVADKISNVDSERHGNGIGRPEPLILVELDPPFDIDISRVMQGAKLLKEAGADMLTLADSPMARVRMDAAKLAAKVQREVGIPVMPHICCRDKNVIAMRSGILGDYMNGLRYFLVVTGDPVGRDDRGVITPVFDFNSIRFMEYLAEMNADVFAEEPVCYGGALNYHGANPDAIARRMKQKMEHGCSMFLTQPVYSKEDMERIALLKEQTDARIMCGILPFVSYKNAMFLANEMPGIRVPQEMIDRYTPDMSREEAQQAGIAMAVELAEAMRPAADGYYFMTPFNRAGMMAEIVQKVKETGGRLNCYKNT